jgi:allantoinase
MVDPRWPGKVRIAVQIALNYEGRAELNILHGDASSESRLSDTGLPAVEGQRSTLLESSFEYGSRRGVWRLLRILRARQIKISIFGVAMALERNPEVVRAMVSDGCRSVAAADRRCDVRRLIQPLRRA